MNCSEILCRLGCTINYARNVPWSPEENVRQPQLEIPASISIVVFFRKKIYCRHLCKCHIINTVTNNPSLSALETRARINENGRLVIPASFRRALDINAGDELVLRLEDDELRISTLKRRLDRAQRLVKRHLKTGESLVDELISERRETARRE